MANTSWSTTDKANVTLSGSNLVATGTAQGGVRTADNLNSGKFYWELTGTTWSNNNSLVGVANSALVLSSTTWNSAHTAHVIGNGGQIWINGSNSGSSLGTLVTGNIVGIALDQTNYLIWFRLAPSGNWNGSSTANPATGTGGLSTVPITGGKLQPLYGLAGLNSGDAFTANFGGSAFSGAVPAGFTSGFTAGLGFPMFAALTQIAIEEWGLSGAVGTQAFLTQIALEHWFVNVPPIPYQVRAMVLA